MTEGITQSRRIEMKMIDRLDVKYEIKTVYLSLLIFVEGLAKYPVLN